jgi:3-oxoadipyl-CoA thiolase
LGAGHRFRWKHCNNTEENPKATESRKYMEQAFICDAIRTPFGRYGGVLATVRADDLAAVPIKALMERNRAVDWGAVDDVIYGCANQAGEDNRNVARMALLLAGLPKEVSGCTVNRLCGSSLESIAMAARTLKSGEGSMIIAGGVESMSRAPFVVAKSETSFSRNREMEDTTIGWRFVNAQMKEQYGIDSMPETAENVAQQFHISRHDQDLFALRSQQKTARAMVNGTLAKEIIPVLARSNNGELAPISVDEHPRPGTTFEALAHLRPIVKSDGSVTAGNSSGVNDGACALLIVTEKAAHQNGLTPLARIVCAASAGVEPRIMGIGPVPATRKALDRAGLKMSDIDVIELNEAFASQSLAVLRELGIADDAEEVNPSGGAIALGHPLGASGARLVTTATYHLHRTGARLALCTMCIGVGQGLSLIIERL